MENADTFLCLWDEPEISCQLNNLGPTRWQLDDSSINHLVHISARDSCGKVMIECFTFAMFAVQGVPQKYVQLDGFLAFACNLFFDLCLLTFHFFWIILVKFFCRKDRMVDTFTPAPVQTSSIWSRLLGNSAVQIARKFINYLLMLFSLFFAEAWLSVIHQNVENIWEFS